MLDDGFLTLMWGYKWQKHKNRAILFVHIKRFLWFVPLASIYKIGLYL